MFRPPDESGIAACGFEHDAAAGIPEARLLADMERFAASAKKAGLSTYAHGLRTISQTIGAIAAGFDFLDGDVVTSVVDMPCGAYVVKMSDLFDAKLGANAGTSYPGAAG